MTDDCPTCKETPCVCDEENFDSDSVYYPIDDGYED